MISDGIENFSNNISAIFSLFIFGFKIGSVTSTGLPFEFNFSKLCS
jgi:hypothetical protein